jgi:cardiolipin synthase A/B
MELELYQYISWGAVLLALQIIGILSAINALLRTRSSQSAIAWAISCLTIPSLAVPAYWIFGKTRFHGYVSNLRNSNSELANLSGELRKHMPEFAGLAEDDLRSCRVFEQIAEVPFTRHNAIELLVNGSAYFERVFEQIAQARDYILIQFFILRADELGERLRQALAAKAAQGVRIHLLYDQIGSQGIPRRFVEAMRRDGVDIRAFRTSRGWSTRLQINFRNHRKAVIVDGEWAATGGANVGLEYCGKVDRFGDWRDTMVAFRGPAVQELQLSFICDWYFVTRHMPELNWRPQRSGDGDKSLLVLPSGPADRRATAHMMIIEAINSAENRLWITSPYFVPDDAVIRALQLAALRGVDVRIMLPEKPDHLMVYWASFTYFEEFAQTGIRFYRYTKGFMHQKVLLIDEALAMVGSCNMDNRSFHLNFEVMVLAASRSFAHQVKDMLERDFESCIPAGVQDYQRRGPLFRVIARLSRLFSPIL